MDLLFRTTLKLRGVNACGASNGISLHAHANTGMAHLNRYMTHHSVLVRTLVGRVWSPSVIVSCNVNND